MSHITCPYCGSNDHTSGYGLAAGPMGAYTFCNSCDELIEFTADTEGLDEEQIAKLNAMKKKLELKWETARRKKSE